MLFYVILILAVLALAAVLTIQVGFSKQNQEGNPNYEKKAGKNLVQLSVLYTIAGVLSVLAFIYYFFM